MAALAAVAMLSVQGCDAAGAPAQAETSAHSVTIAQAQGVYQAYLASSDAAAQQGNATAGLADVADAAWEIAHGQYAALAASKIPVPRYQYGTPRFFVPAQNGGYPRWFVVSVPRRQVGAGAAVTTLMAFSQTKPADNWTLDGTTALEPGQQLPAIAVDAVGYATALSTRDANPLLPPDVVGATQAAVVDDGPSSPAASLIASGPDTTGLYRAQSAVAASQSAGGLQYTWLMAGASFPVFALKLTDGGALVLYGMFLNTTNAHPGLAAGAPIPVPPNFSPLLAAPTEVGYHEVYAYWTYQYAAIDPPGSASNGSVRVIAATGGPSYGHAY
ncbi:MAG TPA: hypothetical protein VFB06_28940 [Streptosporangiaceae bacterium]|nr:hypothetical protein [Streptosporangiaceae bacterium]